MEINLIISQIGTALLDVLGIVGLYLLGLLGWTLGKKVKLPAPHVLGGIVLIGGLRIAGFDLPYLPQSVVTALQIALGVMVGARLDRKAMTNIKGISAPAVIISVWAITITLGFGLIIAAVSSLEPTTAILGSSIGGLPEMTVLAHDTDADSVTVVMFHILRMFSTMLIFPLVLKYFGNGERKTEKFIDTNLEEYKRDEDKGSEEASSLKKNISSLKAGKSNIWDIWAVRMVLTLLAAGAFGGLFILVGVPAGGLVGGMLFMIGANYIELPVAVPPQSILSWFLVGIGLMVSNQVSPETVELIFSGELIVPLVLSLTLTMASSLGVAVLIAKLTNWDFIMCFIASAPAGFTVMTGLALEEGYDPVRVSLLHLTRLVTLKLLIPFLFMVFY